MEQTAPTLLFGAFTIAALHAIIPSHWLSFTLIGRSEGWSVRRTLLLALLAGGGHLLLTITLGLVVAFLGKELPLPHGVEHAATSGLLCLLGLYYLLPALRGQKGCTAHTHEHHTDETHSPNNSDRKRLLTRVGNQPTLMGALILGMTLSPCLDLVALYAVGVKFSWLVLLFLSLVMIATTLGLMLSLVWLSLHGMQRLRLNWLDRNEGLVMGVLLILLGALLFFK